MIQIHKRCKRFKPLTFQPVKSVDLSFSRFGVSQVVFTNTFQKFSKVSLFRETPLRRPLSQFFVIDALPCGRNRKTQNSLHFQVKTHPREQNLGVSDILPELHWKVRLCPGAVSNPSDLSSRQAIVRKCERGIPRDQQQWYVNRISFLPAPDKLPGTEPWWP